MGQKVFDTTLECGCMIAHDSGWPDDIQGDSGLMPCYCEYTEDPKEREKLERIHWESHKKHEEWCEQCGNPKKVKENKQKRERSIKRKLDTFDLHIGKAKEILYSQELMQEFNLLDCTFCITRERLEEELRRKRK